MARLMAAGSLRDHLSTSSSIFVALAGLNVHRQPAKQYNRIKIESTDREQLVGYTFASRRTIGRRGANGAIRISGAKFLYLFKTLVQTQIVAD